MVLLSTGNRVLEILFLIGCFVAGYIVGAVIMQSVYGLPDFTGTNLTLYGDDLIVPSSPDSSSNNHPSTQNLPPALCCQQFGEGKEWGDVRK